MSTEITTKDFFNKNAVKARFENILDKKASGFISTILQIVNANKLLSTADPRTIYNAAITAAVLDLPIDPNLGFAWIVPYKGRAQFQMGWKGFVQLALRTGQYESINVIEVYENQFKTFNRLTEELEADFTIAGVGNIIGYVSYFRLVNGMKKVTYWSKEEVINHAKKYSQAYGKGSMSPWNDKDQFHAMAKKTVLKNMISKWGIMSIEMQKAQLADQSVQIEEGNYQYIDSTVEIEDENIQEEEKRVISFILKAETVENLKELEKHITTPAVQQVYNEKLKQLNRK